MLSISKAFWILARDRVRKEESYEQQRREIEFWQIQNSQFDF